ncbi:MAG: response regulator transcription factor, partial [Chloroflexi bacterium]|nr:response regulator transcription factor [Chloroflexota bacterium]
MILGNAALQRGDIARAAVFHEQSARGFRALASPGEVLCLYQRGLEAYEVGDVDCVRQLVNEIESIGRSRRDAYLRVLALHLRALVAVSESRSALAASLLTEALAFWVRAADQRSTVVTLTMLGHVRVDEGQRLPALEAFADAMRRARVSGERVRLVRALEGCARCFSAVDADAAVRLAGAADAQRQALSALYWPTERRHLDEWLARARVTLGAAGYDSAWRDGRASTLAQAVRLAEALIVGMQRGPAPAGGLSRREQQVASLVVRGLTNKQIAAELVVSAATVRSHVEHILTKLDLRSRAQIAAWATQQVVVTADSA